MSLEQHAFLQRDRTPTGDEWQSAIDRLGFDMQLDASWRPFKSSGFLPCRLRGQLSGFEVYCEEASDVATNAAKLHAKIGATDVAITFRWGSDMAEGACVMIASAALADSFGALVYFPDDDLTYDVAGLVNEAQLMLKEVK